MGASLAGERNMGTQRIYLSDEPILRKKAKKVRQFDGLQELVDDMVETLHAANGVGLAAPQIGVPRRIIVVQLPEDFEEPEAGRLFVMINPEIVEASEDQEIDDEGCLSVPGFVGEVPRATAISLRAQNVRGKPFRFEASGYLARVCQHEIDHLDGVLFIDRVTAPEKLRKLTKAGEEAPIEPAV